MNNISTIYHCYGCGVCATVCTKNIINISHNKDGFYMGHRTKRILRIERKEYQTY